MSAGLGREESCFIGFFVLCCLTLVCVMLGRLGANPETYSPLNRSIPSGTLLFANDEGVYRCDLPSLKPIELPLPNSIGGDLVGLSGPYRGVLACEYYLGNSYVLRKDPKLGSRCIVVRNLGEATSPTVSPDGKLVAYYGPRSSLSVYDLRTGKVILLSNSACGGRLSWAADSQRLVCCLRVHRRRVPNYRPDAANEQHRREDDVSAVGLMNVRSKAFQPISSAFSALLARDDKSLWTQDFMPDSEIKRIALTGEKTEDARLKIGLEHVLGWVAPDLIVYTADAIDKDKQAPTSGRVTDITQATAIRVGTLDGRNARPLAYVNAVGGWLDPSTFCASFSPDRW